MTCPYAPRDYKHIAPGTYRSRHRARSGLQGFLIALCVTIFLSYILGRFL